MRIFTPLGGIGVALFLLLSGYGLNESFHHSGLISFWWKKLTRIGVPWFICCLMFFIIGLTVPKLSKIHSFIIRYWYLEYLIIWCFVYWLGRKAIRQRDMFFAFITIVSIVMFFVWPCLQAEQSLSFAVGVAFSEKNRRAEGNTVKSKEWFKLLPMCFFVYATFFLFAKQMPEIRNFGEQSLLMKVVQLNIKLPYALSVAFFLVQRHVPGWLEKMMVPVGVLSLELYLVQMEFFPNIHGRLWALLLVTVVVVVLSILLHYIVKFTVRPLKAIRINV